MAAAVAAAAATARLRAARTSQPHLTRAQATRAVPAVVQVQGVGVAEVAGAAGGRLFCHASELPPAVTSAASAQGLSSCSPGAQVAFSVAHDEAAAAARQRSRGQRRDERSLAPPCSF